MIRGCQYAVLDRLDAGETVRVDESQVRFWTEYQEENNEENGDCLHRHRSLVEYLKQRYMMEMKIRIRCWSSASPQITICSCCPEKARWAII